MTTCLAKRFDLGINLVQGAPIDVGSRPGAAKTFHQSKIVASEVWVRAQVQPEGEDPRRLGRMYYKFLVVGVLLYVAPYAISKRGGCSPGGV